MEVHLLVHPVGHRVPLQVLFERCERHDQRHQPLAVVLDEAQELLRPQHYLQLHPPQ